MAQRLTAIFLGASLVAACGLRPAHGYVADDRWERTATNPATGAYGTSITLTWSLAPDGTLIPGNPSPAISSNLIGFLDATFGAGSGGADYTLRPWFAPLNSAFERIDQLSGVAYQFEPFDDGVAFADAPSAHGVLGVRGDIRLGGKSYGANSNVLATNFFPDFGELMLNTTRADLLGNPFNSFLRLRNTVMHEALHGLGISHVVSPNANFLAEPVSTVAFDGPQLDDILALHRLYGDALEKNGGNDAAILATPLGGLTASQSLRRGTAGDATLVAATDVDFLSIDDDSDADFFSFTLAQGMDVSVLVTPKGPTYSVGPETGPALPFDARSANNLSVTLLDGNGTTQLGPTADANAAGAGEAIYRHLNPGQYFVRVNGGQNNVQLYQIELVSGFLGAPAIRWTGALSNAWDATTANFASGPSPDTFHDLIDVTFDDTAATTSVALAAAVRPGDVVVSTAGHYTFTGPAGLIAGTLTVDGPGTVELANAGNSYSGATVVAAGTLKITGNANAMASPISVHGGATLVLDATDAAGMASAIEVQAGGELHIGTLASDANVLGDNLPGVANAGVVRVRDDETVLRLSGSGALIVEHETAVLTQNGGFQGAVTIKSGAVAVAVDSEALGDGAGQVTVEAGGRLQIVGPTATPNSLNLAGSGGGHGALHVQNSAVFFQGDVAASDGAVIRVEDDASAFFFGSVVSQGAAPMELRAEAGGDATLGGGLTTGTGGIRKTGTGLVTLSGALALAGPARVDSGRLRLAGSGSLANRWEIAAGATLELAGSAAFTPAALVGGAGVVDGPLTLPGVLAPGLEGATGSLAVLDELTLTGSSVVEFDLGGAAPGSGYDWVDVGGHAMLDGTLDVALLAGFVPAASDAFTLLTAANVTGEFDALNLPALGSGLAWRLSYSNTAVTLLVDVAVTGYAADFDESGSVTGADLAAWRTGFGTASGAMRGQGDANADGDVDGGDFLVWQREFLLGGAAAGALASVPEPGCCALAAAGLAAMVARRRRR